MRCVGGDAGVFTLPLHGEDSQYIPFTGLEVRRPKKGGGDIHGVFSASTEVGDVPSRRMNSKGGQLRET